MATRRKARTGETRIAFDTLSIEGGLLSPEWISRVAQVAADAQSEADYRVPRGLALRDEIGRFWRIAQAHWTDFAAGRAAGTDPAALSRRFVTALLKDALGFESLEPVLPIIQGDRAWPIGHAALDGRVPVVVAPAAQSLDTLVPAFGDGGRRRSAFGLAQEALNAVEDALWGIATDGVTLRILRDNESLTRPAWVEADLDRIFTEQRYADFAALWLLAHETRFGRAGQPPADCPLEVWRTAGRAEGIRARDQLRQGVEHAVEALGQGFLAHPDNGALRGALHAGDLTPQAYFNELLRLVYRLIFLLTIEERGLLHPPGSDPAAQALYAQGYGLRRLRDRSIRRSAHDRHHDLWEGVRIVVRGLAAGEPRLALPALAGLFAPDQCPRLDAARLENRALMLAMFRLSWLREDGGLVRVNWRDMGPEELGSVYESLLELVPVVADDGRRFAFATGNATKGNVRKTTGSYYTPDSLVQILLDSALEPVVADTVARNPDRPAGAILDLTVVDPACGSGHFLLAAARRLAGHVARYEANGTPSAAEYRHALRQVVGRCIHGVDLNPMAVELCQVSLWLEALDPGKPLSFLHSHIRCGNSLLGATPELVTAGLPDEAFDAIEGDDKKACSSLRKRNRTERQGLGPLFAMENTERQARLQQAAAALEDLPDDAPETMNAKVAAFAAHEKTPEYRQKHHLADAWCAAFVVRKSFNNCGDPIGITQGHLNTLADGRKLAQDLEIEVERLSKDYRFFHWHLAFPQVHGRGGFDVVVGNPPWERLKIETEEWMSAAGIETTSVHAAARGDLLALSFAADHSLSARWTRDRRFADGSVQLLRGSGRYPMSAVGDLNSYAMFAELTRDLLCETGYGALVLPLGILSDKTYGRFFGSLLERGRLVRVCGFVNERKLFSNVLHNFKFVSMTLGPARRDGTIDASFEFGLLDPKEAREEPSLKRYKLTWADVASLNPETTTCPMFLDGQMARVLTKIHRVNPTISRSEWCAKPRAMLHMGAASKYFEPSRSDRAPVPVFESKMIHRYNHRFGSFGTLGPGERAHMLPRCSERDLGDPGFEPTPAYFCPQNVVSHFGPESVSWNLAFRRIANPALARTAAFCFLPRCGAGDSLSIVSPTRRIGPTEWAEDAALLCWLGNSIVFDSILKQKMGGPNFSEYIWNQLPIPSPATVREPVVWLPGGQSLAAFVIPRVCELSVTSHLLLGLAQLLGFPGAPFRWDPIRRRVVEAELDAAAAVAYGLTRSEFETVFRTFPVLETREVEREGDFVTRAMALEQFDAMTFAQQHSRHFQTRLDPPPADPRLAHPDTRGDTR